MVRDRIPAPLVGGAAASCALNFERQQQLARIESDLFFRDDLLSRVISRYLLFDRAPEATLNELKSHTAIDAAAHQKIRDKYNQLLVITRRKP